MNLAYDTIKNLPAKRDLNQALNRCKTYACDFIRGSEDFIEGALAMGIICTENQNKIWTPEIYAAASQQIDAWILKNRSPDIHRIIYGILDRH